MKEINRIKVEKAKQDYKDIRVVLRGLRDEIRVQIHLAGMDLKKEWEKLEPRLDEAESMIDAVSAAATAATHDVERRARALRDELKRLSHRNPAH
jgi:predicted nuclease with TOPRIM domain